TDLGLKQGHTQGDDNFVKQGVDLIREAIKMEPDLAQDPAFISDLSRVSKDLPKVVIEKTGAGAPDAPRKPESKPGADDKPRTKEELAAADAAVKQNYGRWQQLMSDVNKCLKTNGAKCDEKVKSDFTNAIELADGTMDNFKISPAATKLRADLEKIETSGKKLTNEQMSKLDFLRSPVETRFQYAQALHLNK